MSEEEQRRKAALAQLTVDHSDESGRPEPIDLKTTIEKEKKAEDCSMLVAKLRIEVDNKGSRFEEPRSRRAFLLWRAFAFMARTRLCALVEACLCQGAVMITVRLLCLVLRRYGMPLWIRLQGAATAAPRSNWGTSYVEAAWHGPSCGACMLYPSALGFQHRCIIFFGNRKRNLSSKRLVKS